MVRAGIVANGEEERIIVAARNYIVYINPCSSCNNIPALIVKGYLANHMRFMTQRYCFQYHGICYIAISSICTDNIALLLALKYKYKQNNYKFR